jgi:hypothetical protein
MHSCEYCAYFIYDEDSESYYCDIDLDEDDYYNFIKSSGRNCPYFRNGDEYGVVKHQM